MINDRPDFIDLFAGIGGFHEALSDLGFDCVFASENDKHAKKTYLENFKLEPEGDIRKIKNENIPKHDVLCAGFPCQAFSISGKQAGFRDTRGTLFFEILRIANFHKPKVLFLENVKNFQNHNKGNTLKVVISSLSEIGYKVFYKVLNAGNFGLPQKRERIYIIGFRKDLKINSFRFPEPLKINTSLYDIIEQNPVDAKIINRDDIFITEEFEPKTDLFDKIVYPNKPVKIGYVNKGGQGERIYSPYGHSITLSAYGGGVGSKTGLYLIGRVIRKLSTRECARLQGFPENFKISDSKNQAYKQFGNSVAINVIKEIMKKIIETGCF